MFDEGSLALSESRFDDALQVFEELDKLSIKDANVQSSIKIRKGQAQYHLGQTLEAETNFLTALADIDQSLPNYATDIFTSNNFLARMASNRYEYTEAAEYYLAAANIIDRPSFKLNAMAGAVATLMFVDTKRALILATEAYEISKADKNIDKDVRAQTAILLGRTHLNLQNFSEARRLSGRAVKMLGGLTKRVYINDIQVRSDHATASALLDDPGTMRKFLSYTGAGRFEGSAFLKASDVWLPPCDPAQDLYPDDVVIVEFGISNNGLVTYSRPIYSNKPETIALIFAKAVKNWSWTTEQVAEIDPFYRALTRLELRCTQKTPAQPSPFVYLADEFKDWLGGAAISQRTTGSDAEYALQLTDELAAFGDLKPYAENPKKGIYTWVALSLNASVSFNERDDYLDLAIARATELEAPQEVLIYLRLRKQFGSRGRRLNHLKMLKSSAELEGNSIIRAVINLTINDQEQRGKNSDYIFAILQEVIADRGLVEKHPLKIGAQVRLASLHQQLGDENSARRAFQATGLSAGQCAAIDAKPKLKSTGSLSSLYPTNMLRMGITGFSKAEYDITADGKVVNGRIVMAYPPFGFTKASQKIIAKGTFEKSYRPDGGLGCANDTNFIRFNLPGR